MRALAGVGIGRVTAARAVVLVAAVAGGAAFASAAQAAEYQLFDQVTSRGNPQTSFDNGYRGPQFQVTGWGHASDDKYVCPSGQLVSDWLVVPDDSGSLDHTFMVGSSTNNSRAHQFDIVVTNWSTAHTLRMRLAASCTNDPNAYPFRGGRHGRVPRSYGQYQDYWDDQFRASPNPDAAAYGGLTQRAFCWIATPGCTGSSGLGAGRGWNRVVLRNGTNNVPLTFDRPARSRRPPSVRLAGPDGCRARRMPLSVQDGAGHLTLELRCRGLKPGAAARVKVEKAVRRNFRLRRGRGSVRVRLAKPAGKVEPSAYVSFGRANTPCKRVRDRLRMRNRTLTLRIIARCGRAAGNAVGHLDVGGLLAARR